MRPASQLSAKMLGIPSDLRRMRLKTLAIWKALSTENQSLGLETRREENLTHHWNRRACRMKIDELNRLMVR